VLPLKLWAIEQRLGPLPASAGPLTWERVAAAIQQHGSEREAARKLNISRGKLLRLKASQG
jgi:ActR/RegA family two-component response regulator